MSFACLSNPQVRDSTSNGTDEHRKPHDHYVTREKSTLTNQMRTTSQRKGSTLTCACNILQFDEIRFGQNCATQHRLLVRHRKHFRNHQTRQRRNNLLRTMTRPPLDAEGKRKFCFPFFECRKADSTLRLMPTMTAWGGRHMSLHGVHCEHEKTCQCDHIFCLEPEDCMCTCGQCVTAVCCHITRDTISVSNTTAKATEQEVTQTSTLMYPFSLRHEPQGVQIIQHLPVKINTPLRRGCHHRSSTTNCPSNEQV